MHRTVILSKGHCENHITPTIEPSCWQYSYRGWRMNQYPVVRVMDVEGTLPFSSSLETALHIYQDMILLRAFDEKTLTLQRQGRVGTFAPSLGQEAAEIASAYALDRQDWMVPSYRDHGALYVHGLPLDHVILFAMGRSGSYAAGVRALPSSIPIATHLLHAVGLAYALKQQAEPAIAMAYFGDGATSEGDFHEALNFAGVWQVPVLFFCQNNGWAISTPVHRQTHSETLAQKAEAYGIAGVRVDGNDALAVYEVVRQAREKAIQGHGPTLIEAVTYRAGPHTTADDPTRYRTSNEVNIHTAQDPIRRLGEFLIQQGLLTETLKEQMMRDSKERINEAVGRVEAQGAVMVGDMFRHVYQTLPTRVQRQWHEWEDRSHE
ncbi:MAG: pyruvate dehydrogenase (acetyl-transferring) E1 component subunit alpha [Sulfobacillus thermosulfidooxidans]|nr:MAG: pyruvate dehydrogenase (acetyl-transferring) E1 component subunit alpha [Sulfobacillus thermosulfidooxidans]